LETTVVDGFDKMEVVAAANFDEDDVVGLEGGWVAGFECDEVAVVDFAAHGMAARANFDGFAFAERFDGEFCPTHFDFGLGISDFGSGIGDFGFFVLDPLLRFMLFNQCAET
jgi:hypothetical protein